LDFGLARPSDDATEETLTRSVDEVPTTDALRSELTAAGKLVGTPAYMAPEQLAGGRADALSDQFSFCVSLYEALYGQRPFAGATLAELTANVFAGAVLPPPRGIRAPKWLHRALVRGLARDPEARFPTMAALLAALARDPTRLRRGLIVAALVAVTGVSTWGALEWREREGLRACAAAADELAPHWSDDARARVQAGITATGVSYATTTAEKVTARLDAWASSWRDVRERACLAASVEAVVDPELDARARECLDEARARFVALVGEYQQLDEPGVRGAVWAAASLPDPATCGDAGRLRLQPALPEDPKARAQVQELRRALAEVHALSSAGRSATVKAAVGALLEDAEALGWPPLVQRMKLEMSSALTVRGEYERAKELSEETYYQAGAIGDDALALQAALLLMEQSRDLGRLQEGLAWGASAEMMRRRAGIGDDALEVARVSAERGRLHRDLGELDRARDAFTQALTILEANVDADDPSTTGVLLELGNVHFLKGELTAAHELYTRSQEVTERAFGADHPRNANGLASLANVAFERGELREATRQLERALVLFEGSYGRAHRSVIASIDNLGSYYHALGDLERAAAQHEESLARTVEARGREHADVGYTLTCLASVHADQGRFDQALTELREAVTIAERRPDGARELGVSLVSLGEVERRFGDLAAAAATLERTYELFTTSELAKQYEFIEVLTSLARVRLAQGRRDEAEALARRAVALAEETVGVESPNLAPPLVVLAELALARGDADLAVSSATRAEGLLRAREGYRPMLGAARFALARAVALAGDHERARKIAGTALASYRECGEGFTSERAAVEAWIAEAG
ncbi:MAG: tetratricopeptide repeat protein, partial [Myxococcales bacterium]|nr:tetratricopeptide repeat protein [Myxococcales bacterium]